MIKIGECILNEEKILSFDTLAEPEEGVQVVMEGGHTLDLFDVSMSDVEHALIEAGVLVPPDEIPGPTPSKWSPRELEILANIRHAGFHFLAREDTGAINGYELPPITAAIGTYYPNEAEVVGPSVCHALLPHLLVSDGVVCLDDIDFSALEG